MKVTELRVGNLIVDHECEPFFFEVEEIKKNSQGKLSVFYRNGSCMDTYPEPIPITEEWLERMGFVRDDDDGCVFGLNSKETFVYDTQDCMMAINGEWLQGSFYHIHQIQNLYFELTGKELEIKPKKL